MNLKVFTRNIPGLSCLSSLGFCLSGHVFFGLVYGREQSHLKIMLVNDHVWPLQSRANPFQGYPNEVYFPTTLGQSDADSSIEHLEQLGAFRSCSSQCDADTVFTSSTAQSLSE